MWFCANVNFLFGSNRDESSLYIQESFYLVSAFDEAEAKSAAEQMGVAAEHSFVSSTNEEINLKFICVKFIYKIIEDEIISGTEVFSRFVDRD